MKKNNIAIVYGSRGVNAAGLIRSLGMAGYIVIFASTYAKIESKYLSDYWKLDSDVDKQVNQLINNIKVLPSKPALFTTDDTVNFILDDNYDLLNSITYCPGAKGKLRCVSDKTVMSEIASVCGLNVSEYKKFSLSADTICPIPFPVILKPYAGYAGSKGDIHICKTENDFKSAITDLKIKNYSEVMVQHLLAAENQYEIGLMGFSLPNGVVEIPCTIKKNSFLAIWTREYIIRSNKKWFMRY